jgi:hypothetical protein
MRIDEIASAEEQLALWKLISDNTWAAIAQQAEDEAKQKAERAAARKTASKRGTGKSASKPMPPKRLPPPLQHVSAPIAKDAKPATTTQSKPSTQQQQQPAQTSPAASSHKAKQPIEPIAAAPSIASPAPVNATVKKTLPLPPFQRNLSNAAGQKSMGVVK